MKETINIEINDLHEMCIDVKASRIGLAAAIYELFKSYYNKADAAERFALVHMLMDYAKGR